MWIGRGDFDAGGWAEAVLQAREIESRAERTNLLLGTPLLTPIIWKRASMRSACRSKGWSAAWLRAGGRAWGMHLGQFG